MARIAQLKRITKARIDAFLQTVEKPEHILPQLEKEMAKRVTEAARAEAKALAATRGAQRRIDEAAGRAIRLEKGAKNALGIGDVQTARRAVAALIDAEKNTEQLRQSLETAHNAYLSAAQVRMQLQQNLEDLKTRRKELVARSRRVELKKAVTAKSEDFAATEDILDAVAKMETKLDGTEAEIEARNHLHAIDLTIDDQKLERKLHDAEVTARLAELKSKFAPPSNPQ